MKVLIVRTFPDVLNLNTYNVQEIGLAKALACKGVVCGVVLYAGRHKEREEIYEFERDAESHSFKIYWLKGWGFFKNGFMPSVYRLVKEYDVLQVHEYDQILSWIFYRKLKLPTVIYHGPYYHEYAKGYNLKCKIFDTLFLRHGCYEHVLALAKSELAADFLRQKGFLNVKAVGVGIDKEQFQPEAGESIPCRLDMDDARFRMLYVGKIEERRNVYFLISLFESLKKKIGNIQLIIVGNGEDSYKKAFWEKIRPWVEKKDILYFEKASQKELALIYQRANVFVFTSNYEIFGMVLLESMYFGLPVVSSRNGGASVLIRNGENGYIMEQFDIPKWEEKLLWLAENKGASAEMGRKAHETIEKSFLWDDLADQFISAYENAAKEYERYLLEKAEGKKGKKADG